MKYLDDNANSSAILNAIFKTAIDGIITINEQGIITMANQAISHLFQYKTDEIIGQNISLLMPPPDKEQHDTYMHNYHTTNEKKIIGTDREVKGLKKDGTTFPLQLSISEIHLKGERLYAGILHDLTKVSKANQQIAQLNQSLENKIEHRTEELQSAINKLLQSNQQLLIEINERKKIENLLRNTEKKIRIALEKEKELNALKTQFITLASHEFRTPLSTILSSSALIRMYDKAMQKDKRDKHLDKINKAVTTLDSYLNDFISLKNLEEGITSSYPEHFKFNDFCEEVIAVSNPLLDSKHTIKHISQTKNVEVYLDKNLLKNILVNLLSNAIKYSSPEKEIICKNQIVDNHLIISIIDQGVGIPEDEIPYLFTRFFRGRKVDHIQGTGLGLNIVKQCTDLLNGKIEVQSKEQEGTTFTIKIPLS